MRIITVETLKTFLDELNKKYGTEFYSKTESDNRYQQKGESSGSVDFQELARRIPSWQWKVTMPKTVNQTVIATVGNQTYTEDFYAQKGSNITFSAKADTGYIAGTVSPTSATLDKDLTVTVTAATESENVGAGTKTFSRNDGFTVPPKVQVLKWTWAGKDIYTKVVPGKRFSVSVMDFGGLGEGDHAYSIRNIYGGNGSVFNGTSSVALTVSWSTEINKHAIDYDWTK